MLEPPPHCNHFTLISHFLLVPSSHSQALSPEAFSQARRAAESKFDQLLECSSNCMLVHNLMMCDTVNESVIFGIKFPLGIVVNFTHGMRLISFDYDV